jgi:hypothetical protein
MYRKKMHLALQLSLGACSIGTSRSDGEEKRKIDSNLTNLEIDQLTQENFEKIFSAPKSSDIEGSTIEKRLDKPTSK